MAEALTAKLALDDRSPRAEATGASEWDAFKAKLVPQPDGTYLNPEGIQDDRFFEILDELRQRQIGKPERDPVKGMGLPSPSESTSALGSPGASRQAPPRDGRAALRAALVRQPDGGYLNLLGFEGDALDDALALARRSMVAPEPPDFGESDR